MQNREHTIGERTRGRTRPSKRRCITEVAPTPAPKRKKIDSVLNLVSPVAGIGPALLSPVAGIGPALVSPVAGIGKYTRRPATPWPAKRKLPMRNLPKKLREEDRIKYVNGLKQGLLGVNKHPDEFLNNFAIFEYIGIVGTPGQRTEPGDKIYEDAYKMIKGISEDLYRRNYGKFFGGFVGLDVIIHKNFPDSYRIVHQMFCGSKTDVRDLTRRLYRDKRLFLIVCMTGQEHVPDTHSDMMNGCFLREGVELGDFALQNEAGAISHTGGSTYGAQSQSIIMPTPRRPSPPETAPAPSATAETKPRLPAPIKVVKEAENKHVTETKFISGISFAGNILELVGFKQKDYLAIYKAVKCFIPTGLDEDSTAEAVQHLRNVTERVKVGCMERNACIRPLRPFEHNDFSTRTNDFSKPF